MNYTKIKESIWQIADDDGVYCTLIKGNELAILLDTGFGRQNLQAFIAEHISTEYIVINSHGHPDHIGSNSQFDEIYACELAFDEIAHYTREISDTPIAYELKRLVIGQILDLGGIHAEVISLAGHTKGSIGLLIPEERLLLAGDALNPCLWMFNYGALPISQLRQTLTAVKELSFDTYLYGHSDKEMPKQMLDVHLKNIETIRIEASIKSETLGIETYESTYEENGLQSVIVYDKELL